MNVNFEISAVHLIERKMHLKREFFHLSARHLFKKMAKTLESIYKEKKFY